MPDEDSTLVTGVVVVVVQALKPTRINAAFYGVVALATGILVGALLGYTRNGESGIASGAVGGIRAALQAGGLYGFMKSMSEYTKKEEPRG